MSAKAKNKLTPQQRKATLNRVLHKIRPYSAFVVCSLLVAAVSVAAQLYIPILCGDAIDKMLGKGNVDLAGVLRIAVSILVVAAVAALAQWLLSVCNNRITFSVSRDLRNEALRKIQTLPLSYLDSHPSGDIVSRMVADVDTFADGLLMGFTQLFSGILTIFGTLLFMLRENVPITLVVVCITPLSLVVAGFLAKRSYGYFQSQSTVRGKQTALVNEMIEGQKVVQAFGHEAESLAAFDEVNGQLQDVSLKAIFFSSLTNPATRFVNNIVYAGVGLVGALYAVRGGITIGQLSVFLSYANQYTKPFNEISGVVTELQNALACAARVFELLDAEDQVPEAENAAALQPDGHVQLQDVSFRYPVEENKPVFCFTTTYQKRKFSKLPKVTVYIDGPFFPDANLSLKDNRKKLRDLVYETMLERSKNSTYEYAHYIKTSPVSAPCPEFVPSAAETKTEEEAIPVGIAV